MRFSALAISTLAAAAVLAPVLEARATDIWTTPHPGIRRLYRTTSTPWRIHVLEVDLCERGVKLRATDETENWNTVPWFGSHVGAEAAVNGDFFSWSTHLPSGLAIGNEDYWHADTSGAGFVAFGRSRVWGTAPSVVADPPPDWIRNAVGGHPRIVSNGAVPAFSGSLCSDRHPRTAVGLSRDLQTLYLVVVDGRSSVSAGMTCTELGDLLVDLGAYWALNLDGGGSSTMWVSGLGVVNDPSDGTPRTVANHLAVLASGAGAPGSCDWSFDEVLLSAGGVLDATGTTDVDGDGLADACARAAAGFRCRPSTGTDFAPAWALEELSDDAGWSDETNYATLRMGDVNGDGLADVCGRGDARLMCWPSTGAAFGARIDGPELSDDLGWSAPGYYSTLRLADVDGDRLDDACARSASDFRCWPSTGASFGAAVIGPELSNENGWNVPSRYGSIRMGDVNGDGRADLCARRAAGMRCWLSDGRGFPDVVEGPAWSDDDGWEALDRWSTIRLTDVDGDGRADLCGRTATDFRCHLSEGTAFGPAVIGPGLSDENGWSDHANYQTIRLGDVDGDGDADLCARANARVHCWLWDGTGFPTRIDGPELSDTLGWSDHRYFSTLRLADLNGDRKADLCARGAAGLFCWLSDGAGFPIEVDGPDWADDVGWDGEPYYSTIRVAGPRCTIETCNGWDDDCDGAVDEACVTPDAGAGLDAGGGGGGAGPDGGGGPGAGGGGGLVGSCACRAVAPAAACSPAGEGALSVALAVAAWGLALARRRRLASRCARLSDPGRALRGRAP